MIKDLQLIRKELHRFPELSGNETKTVKRIIDHISGFNPSEIMYPIGGQSLAVMYKYSEKGPVIVIRCELDALPIPESAEFSYKSVHPGISHKCGHDGHMVIVLALAAFLEKAQFLRGKVVLLFQSAEETGKGAMALINDDLYNELQVSHVFALHNLPGYPTGQIIVVKDYFNATVISFSLQLTGVASHASEPENGTNPSIAISLLIQQLNAWNQPNTNDSAFQLFTPIYINMGTEDYGISSGNAEIHYTIRCWGIDKMEHLKQKILHFVDEICAKEDLLYKLDWHEYFPSVANDPMCNGIIIASAQSLNLPVIQQISPFKFGEDFGYLTKSTKGAMFGLGAGLSSFPLHSPYYDFNDELLEPGINMFINIIRKILQ